MKAPQDWRPHTDEDRAYLQALNRSVDPRLGRCFILPTNDDWHPTLPGGFIEVYVVRILGSDETYRITVAGGDDTYLERDFAGWERIEAALRRMPLPVSKTALIEQGYRS